MARIHPPSFLLLHTCILLSQAGLGDGLAVTDLDLSECGLDLVLKK